MMNSLETTAYRDVVALIPAPTALDRAAVAFIEQQDYYQNGDQFTGPKAAPSDAEGQAYLEASFVALPKLGELCGRHVDGVVGREPSFEVVTGEPAPLPMPMPELSDSSQAPPSLKAEIDAVQGRWWDEEALHETVQVFASHLVSSGAAFLRYDLPPGLVVEAQAPDGALVTAVEVEDWQEALALIYVEVAAPGTAGVYRDPATRQQYALYSYAEQSGEDEVRCVQISWVKTRDEAGHKLATPLTVVRVVRDDGTHEQVELDTGGVPLLIEARFHPRVFAPFVSPANVLLNNAINAAATMAKINVDVAGFPQQNHLDIEPPTLEVPAAGVEGGAREIPAALETGPRQAPFLMSAVDEEVDPATGQIVRTVRRGTIVYRQPVSSEPILQVLDFNKRGLYEACRQAHILNDIAAGASGVARVEARADFAHSLLKTKPKIEGALRQLLRGTRCLAAFLAQDARLDAFKAARDSVRCHATSGALTPDERRIVLDVYAAGLYSQEEAMVLLGVEDVDAELAKIEAETMRRDFGDGWPLHAVNASEATDGDPTKNGLSGGVAKKSTLGAGSGE